MKNNMKPFDKFLPQIHNITNRHRAFNVRLFGPMARGNATASCDLDLLIDPAPGRDLFNLISIKQELEAVTGFKVDVVAENSLSKHLRKIILEEAKSL
jgi:uncharacterized protein